jgi:hypothetical protein
LVTREGENQGRLLLAVDIPYFAFLELRMGQRACLAKGRHRQQFPISRQGTDSRPCRVWQDEIVWSR